MDEQRRIAGNGDKVTVGESFVGCVTGSRCVTEAGTAAGHVIQGMLLLLIGALLRLTGVVMIVMRLVGLMVILRISATTQTRRGVILTLAAT